MRLSCSALALYLHRFLESSLAPAFAKRFLGTSAWSQSERDMQLCLGLTGC